MVDGTGHGSKGEEEAERDDARLRVEGDVVDGITRGDFKCLEMKCHLGFITGLGIGGGDKIVSVWSLEEQDYMESTTGTCHM
ncbi:hypothetical protein SASPL_148175 [Salvia splendens]|uniref:Uncharacterized protein n=1 Tax=Salvia splendens TaxID=180675 RepID=A0A8X8W9I0_SALSN|nr:hypothetical protein SASPL_148175 [Salvia splendens]